MNILVIAYYYPPLISGGSYRPEKISKFLERLGHEVTVLTHSYTGNDFSKKDVLRIHDTSFNMHRRGLKYFKWLLLRLLTEFFNILGLYRSIYGFWRKRVEKYSEKIISRVNPQVVLVTYPPVETLELGLMFAEKYGIPLISDFRDGLMFESIESKRISAHKCVRERYEKIERDVCTVSSAITTVSPLISEYLKKTYDNKNVTTIPNGYDPEDFDDLSENIDFEKDFFHVVHTGSIGMSETGRNINVFFSAIRELIKQKNTLKKSLCVHLVGELNSNELRAVEDFIKREIVKVYGVKEKREVLSFQKEADLLLLVTSSTRRYMAPAKIYEYLYSGKPILALAKGTYADDIVSLTNTGWAVDPNSHENIYDLVKRIVNDYSFYDDKVHNRKNIEMYSWKNLAQSFNSVISNIN